MRCNNCCRHVENHEKMFRRPVKNTIGMITTRSVELVCEDCLPEVEKQMTDYRGVKRKSAWIILIAIIIGFIIKSFVIYWILKN
jgi:hypothetical protein